MKQRDAHTEKTNRALKVKIDMNIQTKTNIIVR